MTVKLPPPPPIDERTGVRVMPLADFPPEKQAEFEQTNALPRPPYRYRKVVCGSMMVTRAWYEWYASRGLMPPGLGHKADRPRRPDTPRSLREAVVERDGMVCQLCGGEIPEGDLHIDHIQPLVLGGPTTLENLQATHSYCNILKGARAVA